MIRGLVIAGLLATLATIVRAEDVPPAKPPAAPAATAAPVGRPAPPPTPEQAADAALAAIKSGDSAALKVLAAKDDPDPWLVADALIRRGELDSADAFAQAAPRVDVEKLPEYVASRRGKADDTAGRARLAATNTALQAGKFADALDAIGALESGPIVEVVGVRLAMGRGIALASLGRLEASAEAFRSVGDSAERLGWLARASRAQRESGVSAYRGSSFLFAREAWERDLSISERRGDKAWAAGTLGNMGAAYQSLGD